MPLRIVRTIKMAQSTHSTSVLCIDLPCLLFESCKIGDHDKLVGRICRHFDTSGGVVRDIDEPCLLDIDTAYHRAILRGHPITEKYGLLAGEAIEVKLDRISKPGGSLVDRVEADLFPERLIEDLEFDPDR